MARFAYLPAESNPYTIGSLTHRACDRAALGLADKGVRSYAGTRRIVDHIQKKTGQPRNQVEQRVTQVMYRS
jgi:hypothetical protein